MPIQENTIVIYEWENGELRIEVPLDGETVWLSQSQLVDLFRSSKANISEHIRNIYAENELSSLSTVRNFRTVQKEGERDVSRDIECYNLDLIISLGYRVQSQVATRFRQWATTRLREYMIKGFSIDSEKLKNLGGGTYWKELLDEIRDIRSSEKVLYRQVLDLYATSVDYDPNSQESLRFFKTVQNKLHYATNKHTAAETIYERADAEKDFMGLMNFSGAQPTKSEVGVAKNYLTEDELFRLNRMVSAFFDLAEIRASEHTQMKMVDWVNELDKFAENYGKWVLKGAGTISHDRAIEKAEQEYKKYQAKTLSPVETAYLDTIRSLQKKVENKTKETTL